VVGVGGMGGALNLYIDDLRPLVHGPPLEVIELHLAAHQQLDQVAGGAGQACPHELHGFIGFYWMFIDVHWFSLMFIEFS